MIITTDQDGYVTGYAQIGGMEGGQTYTGEIPEGFYEDCRKYRLSNGKLNFDNTKQEKEEEARQKARRISVLKGMLARTDYIAAKLAEGAAEKEEYTEQLAQRQSWRDEINALEEE